MLKISLFFAFFLLNLNFALSGVLKNYKVSLTQPNGFQFECFLSGDENFNFYHTKEGYVIIQNEDGYYYFAEKKNSDISSSKFVINTENLGSQEKLNLEKWVRPDESFFVKKHKESIKNYKENGFLTTKSGKVNNLMIFIRFKDQSDGSLNYESYENLLNKNDAVSFKDYYLAASGNKLDVTTHISPVSNNVIKYYQDKKSRDYYRPYNPSTNPEGYQNASQKASREQDLLTYILQQANNDPQLASIDFDSDSDGKIDNAIFMVMGGPDGWSDLLWPHRAWFRGNATLFGKKLYDYNLMLVDLMSSASYGLGTLCHEFFHSLGAPDLYHYNYDNFTPTGAWDIMEVTSNPPQYMSSLLKFQYTNWVTNYLEVSEDGEFKIKPNGAEDSTLYYIYTPNSETDIIVVEFRKRQGRYESSLPGTGLLVYKINYDYWKLGNNSGDNEHYIYRPNGSKTNNGSINTANFSDKVGRTEIGDLTNPKIELTNGKLGNIEIYNIKEYDDYMTFKVSYFPRTIITSPTNNESIKTPTPTIKWMAHPKAKSYVMQVSSDADFSTIFDEEATNNTQFVINKALESSIIYYVRVKIVYDNGESDWSNVTSFKSMPSGVELEKPENNATNVPLYVEFKWSEIENLSYFKLDVSTDTDFKAIVSTKSLIQTNSYTLSSVKLTPQTQYFWKVTAKTKDGLTLVSKTSSFTTGNGGLNLVSQQSDEDVCIGDKYELNVEVLGDVESYSWYYNGELLNSSSEAMYEIPSFQVENNGEYYCKIKAADGSETLQTETFKLQALEAPEISDAPDSVVYTKNQDLVISYHLINQYLNLEDAVDLQWLINGEELVEGDEYQGVKTLTLTIKNPDINFNSKVINLRVISKCGDTLITDDNKAVLSVRNNDATKYFSFSPNPVDDKLTINVNLEEAQNLRISLYSIDGNKIADIYNGFAKQNKFDIALNKYNLTSGAYFIMYEYNSQAFTQKFIKK